MKKLLNSISLQLLAVYLMIGPWIGIGWIMQRFSEKEWVGLFFLIGIPFMYFYAKEVLHCNLDKW